MTELISMRRGALAFAVATAFTLANSPSEAGDRAVIFGDSLTDNGNWLASGEPIAPFVVGPPNYKGRASNGLIWPDFLFGNLNSPIQGTGVQGNVDMAFFGARTDNIASFPTHVPGTRGIPQQISDFLGAGGRIQSTDLVVLWAGANNIRECIDGRPTIGTCLTRAQLNSNAKAAATAQTQNIKRLLNAGGRTFLVPNTPSIAPAPYYPDSADKKAADVSADQFNRTLFSQLKSLAKSAPKGTNIIYADVNAVQKLIIGNPSAFGFSNVKDPCFDGATVCGSPNSYYYWDPIHWSEAAQAYYALYFSLLLDTTPALLDTAPLGDSLYGSGALVTNAVYDRLMNWISGTYSQKNGPYIELLGQLSRIDQDGNRPAYDSDVGGARFGLDMQIDEGVVGGSIALLTGPLDSLNLSADSDSVRGDLYGTLTRGPLYASANVGFGGTWFDNVERYTGFGPLVADSDTDGHYFTASTEIGALQSFAGLTFIPSGRVTYAHAELNGYREQAELLALDFDDQSSDAWLGRASLRAVKTLSVAEMPLSIFAEVGYEDYFSLSGNEISASLINNTALPTSVTPADPTVPGLFTKAGLSAQVAGNLYVDVNYGISFANGNGEAQSGTARIKAHF